MPFSSAIRRFNALCPTGFGRDAPRISSDTSDAQPLGLVYAYAFAVPGGTLIESGVGDCVLGLLCLMLSVINLGTA